jgi:hypothetical protein
MISPPAAQGLGNIGGWIDIAELAGGDDGGEQRPLVAPISSCARRLFAAIVRLVAHSWR